MGWRALPTQGRDSAADLLQIQRERSTIQFLVVVRSSQGRRLGLDRTSTLPVIGAVPGNKSRFFESEEGAQRYSAAAAEHDWQSKLGGA